MYGVGERMDWESVRSGGVYGVGECKEWGSVWTWEGHFLIFGAKIQILFKLGKYSFAFISFTST